MYQFMWAQPLETIKAKSKKYKRLDEISQESHSKMHALANIVRFTSHQLKVN